MTQFPQFTRPTLLLDERRCRQNIERMAHKAHCLGVYFRPHFKTHQSAEIGGWFRDAGVRACTVSSVTMAAYFADNGWDDITIAFSINLRELPLIAALARRIPHLNLLLESPAIAEELDGVLDAPLAVWLKIDCGYHRTGIAYDNMVLLENTAEAIRRSPNLHLKGLLSHFGDSYHAQGKAEVTGLYHDNLNRLRQARQRLHTVGYNDLALSIGDTPSCSLVDDFGDVDEIRPGNFIFYDSTQLMIGACAPDEIAVALACPVTALHPERSEAVLYGGAIHLSKDHQPAGEHPVSYGLPALLSETGWGSPLPGGWVRSLSQEHGVVGLSAQDLAKVQVGGLLCVLPSHSCLALQAMRELHTLAGRRIRTMLSGDVDER